MNFSVTYERWTPEDTEHGDTHDRGFVNQDLSLSEAMYLIGHMATHADYSPLSLKNPPRWFTNAEYDECFETGTTEQRSLHLPDNITPSSAMRIARYLGMDSCPKGWSHVIS